MNERMRKRALAGSQGSRIEEVIGVFEKGKC